MGLFASLNGYGPFLSALETASLLQEAAGRAARFEHTHFCLDPLRGYPAFREVCSRQIRPPGRGGRGP